MGEGIQAVCPLEDRETKVRAGLAWEMIFGYHRRSAGNALVLAGRKGLKRMECLKFVDRYWRALDIAID